MSGRYEDISTSKARLRRSPGSAAKRSPRTNSRTNANPQRADRLKQLAQRSPKPTNRMAELHRRLKASPNRSPMLTRTGKNISEDDDHDDDDDDDLLAEAKQVVLQLLDCVQTFLSKQFKKERLQINKHTSYTADDDDLARYHAEYVVCIDVIKTVETDYMRNFDRHCCRDVKDLSDACGKMKEMNDSDLPDQLAELAIKMKGAQSNPETSDAVIAEMYNIYETTSMNYYKTLLQCMRPGDRRSVVVQIIGECAMVEEGIKRFIDAFALPFKGDSKVAKKVSPDFHKCVDEFEDAYDDLTENAEMLLRHMDDMSARSKQSMTSLIQGRAHMFKCISNLGMFSVD